MGNVNAIKVLEEKTAIKDMFYMELAILITNALAIQDGLDLCATNKRVKTIAIKMEFVLQENVLALQVGLENHARSNNAKTIAMVMVSAIKAHASAIRVSLENFVNKEL